VRDDETRSRTWCGDPWSRSAVTRSNGGERGARPRGGKDRAESEWMDKASARPPGGLTTTHAFHEQAAKGKGGKNAKGKKK
jgi:hypothetical protein